MSLKVWPVSNILNFIVVVCISQKRFFSFDSWKADSEDHLFSIGSLGHGSSKDGEMN